MYILLISLSHYTACTWETLWPGWLQCHASTCSVERGWRKTGKRGDLSHFRSHVPNSVALLMQTGHPTTFPLLFPQNPSIPFPVPRHHAQLMTYFLFHQDREVSQENDRLPTTSAQPPAPGCAPVRNPHLPASSPHFSRFPAPPHFPSLLDNSHYSPLKKLGFSFHFPPLFRSLKVSILALGNFSLPIFPWTHFSRASTTNEHCETLQWLLCFTGDKS